MVDCDLGHGVRLVLVVENPHISIFYLLADPFGGMGGNMMFRNSNTDSHAC